jgi:predicted helicase
MTKPRISLGTSVYPGVTILTFSAPWSKLSSRTYKDFLTLSDILKETYDYRFGNRSALEWVIDQYQISTDKRSGITNDPNREDDP